MFAESAAGTLSGLRRRLMPRTRLVAALRRLWRARFGWRPLQDLALDLRYGGPCGGRMRNPFADRGASPVQSTSYAALARLFGRNAIEIRADDVLVDVGCGPGRVISFWLSRGLRNRMIGLELVEPVAARARRRLGKFANVDIVAGDAVANLPPAGTFFYLYNPFDAAVLARFAERLLAVASRPRELRILYFNCRHLDVFRRDPRWRVRLLDTGEPEPAALITRPPTDHSARRAIPGPEMCTRDYADCESIGPITIACHPEGAAGSRVNTSTWRPKDL